MTPTPNWSARIVTPTRLSASFPPSLPGAAARPVRVVLPERDSPRPVGRSIGPRVRLPATVAWFRQVRSGLASSGSCRHPFPCRPSSFRIPCLWLGRLPCASASGRGGPPGLPHVNIRLPTRLLIGVADGGNVGFHLVKSGMHFLYIRLHGFDVFLAHRLHLLMPLCPLARPYAGCRRRSRLRPA